MPSNTRWGRAGWGRNPSSLRRQMPPSFRYRHTEPTATQPREVRYVTNIDDSPLYSHSDVEAWLESLPDRTDER